LLHSGRIVVRSDRPSSIVAPNRNITKVEIGDVGQQPQRRPGQVEQPKPKCAAPDSSATTRQGIKNAIAPARNVGERARRRQRRGETRSGTHGVARWRSPSVVRGPVERCIQIILPYFLGKFVEDVGFPAKSASRSSVMDCASAISKTRIYSWHSIRLHAPWRLPDDPLQRLVLMALIVGSYLGVQKNSDRANQPMLPIVPGDDRDALHLLLMIFYELGMIFESRNILPAFESGSVNEQPDFSILPDDRIDLRRNLREIVNVQFLRRNDFQRIGGDNFYFYHANSPSRDSDPSSIFWTATMPLQENQSLSSA
jgi:hypothetical protein